jgi:predicted RNA-binding protein with PUA-like domain
MAYWLLKTEPSTYSWEDLEKEKQTRWDGVTAPAALQHIRKMKPGDQAVIYHSGDIRAAVGLAEVTTAPYVDPEGDSEKLAVVDVKAVRRLKQPVALNVIKSNPLFAESPLVRISRLSVVPLTPEQFRVLTR